METKQDVFNLENVLGQLGQQQQGQAQTSIQNARANEQLGLQKMAAQRQAEQFQFGVNQAQQQRAIDAFGNLVQMEAKVNPYQAQALQQFIATGQVPTTQGPNGQQMPALTPDLMTAARSVYSKLDTQTKSQLPKAYGAVLGGASANMNTTGGDVNNQSQPSNATYFPGESPLSQTMSNIGESMRNDPGIMDATAANPLAQVIWGAEDLGQGFQNALTKPYIPTPTPTYTGSSQQLQTALAKIQQQRLQAAQQNLVQMSNQPTMQSLPGY